MTVLCVVLAFLFGVITALLVECGQQWITELRELLTELKGRDT